ncbi:hypothetical protein [Paenibacillus gyeongsangnamensis]|uniref:hypothetical protein n=1 Tax=Paenibacillus gyeongsangnamensis TaxID=3388067 RepID=UPI002FD0B2A0
MKYKLIEMPSETVLLQGNEKRYMDQPLKEMMDAIFEKINYRVDIDAHRVVHGADLFDSSVLVSNEVMERIESISYLAPLHNPINLEGIHLAQQKV